jgi:hypothetical protein
MIISQQEFNFSPSIINYYEENNISLINNFIFNFIRCREIHSNDIAILGDKISILRNIDFEIRNNFHEDTITTFESKEEFIELRRNNLITSDNLGKIRRAKKVGFWLNTGMIKLSTVHSFKGWEIHTLFLLIDKDSTPELVYTGITRARQNIVIINLDNHDFVDFFKNKCTEN